MTTTDARKAEMLKRAGRDPVEVDKRPLSIIMNDEIPYARWEKERKVLLRTGHSNWVELLQARADAKDN